VMTAQLDMFAEPAATGLIGLKVKLDRPIDRDRPCCNGIAIIKPGKPPHAGEFCCATCGSHRGWASKAICDFVATTAARFGAPREPVIVRHLQQENKVAFQQKPMTGSLFKNTNKESETDRDYSGSLVLDDGREMWVSGYVRTSKAGGKYLSLGLKNKSSQAPDKSKPIAEDLNDAVSF
jgi:hypothetical protein